ncbi:hypothetical protein PoB_000000700 [Plakobranchus ocellatus]|uniref:Uncharacterized protein n=1 Tax=Plakobranchus ocellatus TaxID=259542 RepID=A0AAV3XRJ6_9GAST|nr:hypothetical protein PoB_000000700 [Plakobranchus ocellatus]
MLERPNHILVGDLDAHSPAWGNHKSDWAVSDKVHTQYSIPLIGAKGGMDIGGVDKIALELVSSFLKAMYPVHTVGVGTVFPGR